MIIRDESIQLLYSFEMNIILFVSFSCVFYFKESFFCHNIVSVSLKQWKKLLWSGDYQPKHQQGRKKNRKKFMMIFIFRELLSVFNKKNLDLWLVWPKSFHPICYRKKALKKNNKKYKFKSHKNETVLQHLKGLTSLIVKQVFWSISCE